MLQGACATTLLCSAYRAPVSGAQGTVLGTYRPLLSLKLPIHWGVSMCCQHSRAATSSRRSTVTRRSMLRAVTARRALFVRPATNAGRGREASRFCLAA